MQLVVFDEFTVLDDEVRQALEAIERFYKAVLEMAELEAFVVDPEDADPAEEIPSNYYVYDFSCSCWVGIRLDLIPWYTSGFR